MSARVLAFVLAYASVSASAGSLAAAPPSYDIEQAVALAQAQNPDIAIARKKVIGARGGLIEARSGFLPSLTSTGLYDKRQQQNQSQLRQEDYNATLKLEQNLYTGGQITSQRAIAQLNIEKQNYELQETASHVAMDVRIAFNDCLLNRAKVRVRQDSVRVLDEELKSQQQSFNAGIVGKLNVQRAEVALANEQPELFNAQTQLKDSYLRLGDLFGLETRPGTAAAPFEVSGELRYQPNHPDLNDCLARADANRAVIKARQKDIEIEDQQYILDRSAMRPHVRAFSGYEVYSERDPAVGPEFNYGYVVGINATWNIFDGFATKGRMQATRARREAAVQALAAARRAVASEVRSAFFDLQQAEDWEHNSTSCKPHPTSLGLARRGSAQSTCTTWLWPVWRMPAKARRNPSTSDQKSRMRRTKNAMLHKLPTSRSHRTN
jgi:outer membrane protein